MPREALDVIVLPKILRVMQRLDFPRKLGICERLFANSLSRNKVCWVPTASGITWKLDLANPTHRWIVYGNYEGSAFLDWARGFLPADAVIVDSGANVGQMLLYFVQFCPDGRVLAFEPCTEAADWLVECLTAHESLPVELYRCGLGEADAELFLQVQGGEHLHGSWNRISEVEGEPVHVRRLDDILATQGIKCVDLWKLDVEGYELCALRGAEAMLKAHSIKAIYAELAFGIGERVVEYLRRFDYGCRLFDRRGRLYRPSTLPQHTNGLFLPGW